ncbi:MAG: transporter substrate-binding domain-containing protein [Oscillospiraceae bacterium]
MKKFLAICLTAVLSLSFLTACGGKKDDKLVMLTNASFPPFEYVKDGTVQGVDAEIAALIAQEMGKELEIVDMDFDLIVAGVKGGKGDIGVAGMSISEERLEQVTFSVPYVDSVLIIVVPVGSDIKSPADLAGKTIAVQEGTTADLFVNNADNGVNAKEVLSFKNAVTAGTTVAEGKADAAVIDNLTGENVVSQMSDKLEILPEELGHEQYAIAMAKDAPQELVDAVNKVLTKLVEDGTVDELITKHMEASK